MAVQRPNYNLLDALIWLRSWYLPSMSELLSYGLVGVKRIKLCKPRMCGEFGRTIGVDDGSWLYTPRMAIGSKTGSYLPR